MEEGVKAKKGYSIWSLLVIMTLLAVWMAIPRTLSPKTANSFRELFIVTHQIALWTLVGTFIWLLTGKKRRVLIAAFLIVFLAWAPFACALVEKALSYEARTCAAILRSTGLLAFYEWLYTSITEVFDYVH